MQEPKNSAVRDALYESNERSESPSVMLLFWKRYHPREARMEVKYPPKTSHITFIYSMESQILKGLLYLLKNNPTLLIFHSKEPILPWDLWFVCKYVNI